MVQAGGEVTGDIDSSDDDKHPPTPTLSDMCDGLRVINVITLPAHSPDGCCRRKDARRGRTAHCARGDHKHEKVAITAHSLA